MREIRCRAWILARGFSGHAFTPFYDRAAKEKHKVPPCASGSVSPIQKLGRDDNWGANEEPVQLSLSRDYDVRMRHTLRFLWNATKGHRLAPWRSPYLLWRIETYTGVKMTQIGFLEFWEFMWRERRELWRFLRWTGEMDRYVHPKPKSS
jgi:hypothetical protein